MITTYRHVEGALRRDAVAEPEAEAAIWVDLLSPTPAEEARVEAALGIDAPTREDMDEIEASSRLYVENEALVMTVLLPGPVDSPIPEMAPVSFVLSHGRLATVRYHEPRAFETYASRAEKAAPGAETGEGVLIGLLEAVVDRLADRIERNAAMIDRLSREVFRGGEGGRDAVAPLGAEALRRLLGDIGRAGDALSDYRNSLTTLGRAMAFLAQWLASGKASKDLRQSQKTLARDVASLADHALFLSQKVQFLLDATLGLINIEQNQIIKIFSVVAVAFLPPTLIASIYGMNFEVMPELEWPFGYPMALGLMVLSAIVPMFYFRRRGWL